MLICNNCGHTNETSTVYCAHCQMKGNFSIIYTGERISEEGFKQEVGVQCRNCGSESPGEAPQCRHCHFPLPPKQKLSEQGYPDQLSNNMQ